MEPSAVVKACMTTAWGASCDAALGSVRCGSVPNQTATEVKKKSIIIIELCSRSWKSIVQSIGEELRQAAKQLRQYYWKYPSSYYRDHLWLPRRQVRVLAHFGSRSLVLAQCELLAQNHLKGDSLHTLSPSSTPLRIISITLSCLPFLAKSWDCLSPPCGGNTLLYKRRPAVALA